MSSRQLRIPGQLWLAGLEAAPEPPRPHRHNLFFALRLDEAARGTIAAMTSDLRRTFGLRSPPVTPEQLHLTLFPVASCDEPPRPDLVDRARGAAASVAAAPFTLELDRVLSFRNRRPAKPLVLAGRGASEPFAALQRRISLAVGASGLHARPHGFGTPHVTMSWDRDLGRELEVGPVPLEAREFAFIHSHVGQRRHDMLGRWPLRG
ncbi:2'-5' RNA ligase family protein [Roseococcus sp. SYP-B2431]|uniref:2'-5' RNA ligase family protein n=1 Tax=Roseococcus sp. SYP-B2431 TaxID=2496640 RepID=UPI0013F43679|nr:2'-5' RNA ligase family protein [Roseococcus sp. SYP-B2431]